MNPADRLLKETKLRATVASLQDMHRGIFDVWPERGYWFIKRSLLWSLIASAKTLEEQREHLNELVHCVGAFVPKHVRMQLSPVSSPVED